VTLLHHVELASGEGPPLVLLHGVTGHALRWRRVAEGPWSTRRVIALDLRGHGHSTWVPPWSREVVAADVVETIEALVSGPVDLVGHSYGGALAMEIMATRPDLLRRVALLDPGFSRPPQLMYDEAEALRRTDGWASYDEAAAARSAGWLLAEDSDATLAGTLESPVGTTLAGVRLHPDVALELEHHLVQGADGRFRFRFSALAAMTTFGELCRDVPAIGDRRPTLLVVADRAGVVTPAVLAALRGQLGGELSVATFDCGHMVLWECFDEVAAAVSDHLSSIDEN
jgi:lipase